MGHFGQQFGVQTTSIISLDAALGGKGNEGDIERLDNYRRKYLASE